MAADGTLKFDTLLDTKGLSTGLKAIGATIGVATGAAVAGLAALSKSAIQNYAEYEQMVGGVETLFKDSGDLVKKYADNAYASAGLSANEYMNTVTSFSARLLQGLGDDTKTAADIANTAVIDMADNVNKMGTSMESIQNAYQGFAKQNYTMLDNLRLGYFGTASEMARLINDSGVLGDSIEVTAQTVNDVSFDKMIEAIHVIQTEIGISGITAEEAAKAIADGTMTEEEAFDAMGTTAKEAATTIQGSLGMLSSAWTNFTTGLADDNQDIAFLGQNVINSFLDVTDNIVPRIQILLPRIVDGLSGLVDGLLPYIPDLLNSLVDPLASGVTSLLQGIIKVLPAAISTGAQLLQGVITGIVDNIDDIVAAALEIVTILAGALLEALPILIEGTAQLIASLATGLAEQLPTLIPTIVQGLVDCLNALIDNLPLILYAALQLIQGLTDGLIAALPVLIAALPQIIQGICGFLVSAIPQIIQAGIQLLTSLIDALPQIIETLVAAIPQIIDSLINAFITLYPLIVKAGIDLFISLIEGLPEFLPVILTAIPQIISSIITAISNNLPAIIKMGIQLFVSLIKQLPTAIGQILKAIPQIIKSILNALKSNFRSMSEAGLNLIKGLWYGIRDAAGWLWGLVSGWCSDLVGKITGFFGIASPSKLFKNVIGKNLMLGLAVGIDDNAEAALAAMGKAAKDIADVPIAAGALDTSALESAKAAILAESTIGIAGAAYTATNDPDYDPENETSDRYVETHIYINDKECAKVLTPAISKRLAWEG